MTTVAAAFCPAAAAARLTVPAVTAAAISLCRSTAAVGSLQSPRYLPDDLPLFHYFFSLSLSRTISLPLFPFPVLNYSSEQLSLLPSLWATLCSSLSAFLACSAFVVFFSRFCCFKPLLAIVFSQVRSTTKKSIHFAKDFGALWRWQARKGGRERGN